MSGGHRCDCATSWWGYSCVSPVVAMSLWRPGEEDLDERKGLSSGESSPKTMGRMLFLLPLQVMKPFILSGEKQVCLWLLLFILAHQSMR